MALTRRHVLLSSIVGFVAWGYVVHWLPILRYLAYAFLLGILFTVLLLLAITFTTSWPQRDGTNHVAVVRPSLDLLDPKKWRAEQKAHLQVSA